MKHFKRYLAEATMIIFSVLLALGLNEFRADRKEKRLVKNTLEIIKKEILDNQKLMQHYEKYHGQIIQNINSFKQKELPIDSFHLIAPNGIMQDIIHSTTWDVANGNQILNSLDFPTLMKLSQVYTQQKMTFEPLTKIFDTISSPDFQNNSKLKENLSLLQMQIQELRGREILLLRYYDVALKRLEEI